MLEQRHSHAGSTQLWAKIRSAANTPTPTTT
jgi:hypothetical protein